MSTISAAHNLVWIMAAVLAAGCPEAQSEAGDEGTRELQQPAGSGRAGAPATGRASMTAIAQPSAAGREADTSHQGHVQQSHAGNAGAAAGQPSAGQPASMSSRAATFVVPLTAAEEVPRCVAAAAQGTAVGSASVSGDGQSLSIVLTYAGLSGDATAAHIHFGALGDAGAVVLDLGPDLQSPIRRTFHASDYDSTQNTAPPNFAEFLTALKSGQSYFNLHTAACERGELRGQIDEADPEQEMEAPEATRLNAKLTGTDEIPLCATGGATAVGTGTVAISENESAIAIRVSHSGLSGAPTMGHVHFGAPGERGPVVLNLGNLPSSVLVFHEQDYAPTDPAAPQDFAGLIQAMKNNQTYFNLHTEACPDGELRGQIRSNLRHWSDAPSEFQTRLSTTEEVMECTAAAPYALALAGLVVSADETQIAVRLAHDGLSGELTNAHLHLGGPEENGPVILDLGPELGSPIEKIFKQADYEAPAGAPATFAEVVAAIRAGSTYYNLHTMACGMGEIRGQITP